MSKTITNLRVAVKTNTPMFIGIIAVFGVLEFQHMRDSMAESRWFRDMMNITPFHNVVVDYQEVNPTGLHVSGSLIKRRCTFDALIGYVTFPNKPKQRIGVVTNRPKQSRPPSEDNEAWGPWLLEWNAQRDIPSGFEIYADHINCPTPPRSQTNLFVKGPWEDKNVIEGDNLDE